MVLAASEALETAKPPKLFDQEKILTHQQLALHHHERYVPLGETAFGEPSKIFFQGICTYVPQCSKEKSH